MAPYQGAGETFLTNQAVGLSYALTGIGGITANVIILVAFLRERRRSYFHVQLAIVNILYLTSLALAAPSALRGSWMFGESWCQLFAIHVFTAGYARFALIAVICLECYAAVCFKTWYDQLSEKTYAVVSVVVWLYSIIFGLAPYFGWSSYSIEEGGGTSCGLTIGGSKPNHASYMMTSTGSLVILMLLSVVSLVHAFRESRTDQYQFTPLFNDRELVKTCIGLLVLTWLGSTLYSYRVAVALSGQPNTFGFLGVEMSHILLKMDAAICPGIYLCFSQLLKKLAKCLITGEDPDKKEK